MGSIVDPLKSANLIDLCVEYRVRNATLSALYDLVEEGTSVNASAKIYTERSAVQGIGAQIAELQATNVSEMRVKASLIPIESTDDFECVSDLLNVRIVRSIFRDLAQF